MTQTGVRSGVLLFVLGLWVLTRTVNKDASGRTLIDHILGKLPSGSSSSSASKSASNAAYTQPLLLPSQSVASIGAAAAAPAAAAGGFGVLQPQPAFVTQPAAKVNAGVTASVQSTLAGVRKVIRQATGRG